MLVQEAECEENALTMMIQLRKAYCSRQGHFVVCAGGNILFTHPFCKKMTMSKLYLLQF
jgi:hypothetical protein